ncbi:hypothetical protein BD408DRAFT_425416 [Parasitella parasitica]|nr:hypothetical protein BD408DRAFT_425416 [Parasitella parasitica]
MSFKKRNTNPKLLYIMDRYKVGWDTVMEDLEKARVAQTESEVRRLANKRRKTHLYLHLNENSYVESLINQGATIINAEDDVFKTGLPFDFLTVKNDIRLWRDAAQRVDKLSKQDLLYYGTTDFTNKSPKSAIKAILKENFTVFKNHFEKLYVSNHDIECTIKIEKLSELMNDQFKDGTNSFKDDYINERHYIACFVYPLVQIILHDVSRQQIRQRWGEAKLSCSKQEENRALDDDDRRSSGANIDAIIDLKQLNNMEFVIVEVTGGPTGNHHEHFLEDKNKLAKNLKTILKFIISLRPDLALLVPSLKLFGIQIYMNEIHVYSINSPINNMYIYREEKKNQNTQHASFVAH